GGSARTDHVRRRGPGGELAARPDVDLGVRAAAARPQHRRLRGDHSGDDRLEVVDLHLDRQQGVAGAVDRQQRRRDGGIGETEARAAVHHPGGVHELWRGVDLDTRPAPAQLHQTIAEMTTEPIAVDLVEAREELAPRASVERRVLGAGTIVHPGRHAAGSVQRLQRRASVARRWRPPALYGSTMTGVPRRTRSYTRSTSALRMRMHP